MLKNHGNESQQITGEEKFHVSSTKGSILTQIISFRFQMRPLFSLVRIEYHQSTEVGTEQMQGIKTRFNAKFIKVFELWKGLFTSACFPFFFLISISLSYIISFITRNKCFSQLQDILYCSSKSKREKLIMIALFTTKHWLKSLQEKVQVKVIHRHGIDHWRTCILLYILNISIPQTLKNFYLLIV